MARSKKETPFVNMRNLITALLKDGKPRTSKQIARELSMTAPMDWWFVASVLDRMSGRVGYTTSANGRVYRLK